MNMLILTSFVVAMAYVAHATYNFDEVSPIILRDTKIVADRGMVHYHLAIKFTSPCEMLKRFAPPLKVSEDCRGEGRCAQQKSNVREVRF